MVLGLLPRHWVTQKVTGSCNTFLKAEVKITIEIIGQKPESRLECAVLATEQALAAGQRYRGQALARATLQKHSRPTPASTPARGWVERQTDRETDKVCGTSDGSWALRREPGQPPASACCLLSLCRNTTAATVPATPAPGHSCSSPRSPGKQV